MNDASPEEWRPVNIADGYEVSNKGNVRSVDRTIIRSNGRPCQRKGKALRPTRGSNGYPTVMLRTHDGRRRTLAIHILVCAAFHGAKPDPKYYARHINDVKDDNRAENLAWGTPSENTLDSVRNRTHAESQKTRCKNGHKFTPENTRLRAKGRKYARICRTCAKANAEASYLRRKQKRAA